MAGLTSSQPSWEGVGWSGLDMFIGWRTPVSQSSACLTNSPVASDLSADQSFATKTRARIPWSIYPSTPNPGNEGCQIERPGGLRRAQDPSCRKRCWGPRGKRSAFEENRECVKRPPSQISTLLCTVTAAGPAAKILAGLITRGAEARKTDI